MDPYRLATPTEDSIERSNRKLLLLKSTILIIVASIAFYLGGYNQAQKFQCVETGGLYASGVECRPGATIHYNDFVLDVPQPDGSVMHNHATYTCRCR